MSSDSKGCKFYLYDCKDKVMSICTAYFQQHLFKFWFLSIEISNREVKIKMFSVFHVVDKHPAGCNVTCRTLDVGLILFSVYNCDYPMHCTSVEFVFSLLAWLSWKAWFVGCWLIFGVFKILITWACMHHVIVVYARMSFTQRWQYYWLLC